MSKRENEANELRHKHNAWSCGVWTIWTMSIRQVLKFFHEGKKHDKK